MVDFHTHILPNMDDGADCVETSLKMLRQSFLQGVDVVVSTSHFYANEEYPRDFLLRRKEAFEKLDEAMLMQAEVFPKIILGAEILYFPGMSEAEEISELTIGDTNFVLVEPPMAAWTDSMLDEIVRMGKNRNCLPVIAHVDRYMTYLGDKSLISRVQERNMLVQVNADYFLNPATSRKALKHLKQGEIHFVGSDCHNLTNRAQTLGNVRRLAREKGLAEEFAMLSRNAALLLKGKE